MTYMQRNQSDQPLTMGEATEFLTPEEQAAARSATEHAAKNGKNDSLDADNEEPVREKWGSKFEFIFSCMAFSIGLGNVSARLTAWQQLLLLLLPLSLPAVAVHILFSCD